MKMETVIRSPQDGVIKKLTHKEGVSILPPVSIRTDTDSLIGYLQSRYSVGRIRGGEHIRVRALDGLNNGVLYDPYYDVMKLNNSTTPQDSIIVCG